MSIEEYLDREIERGNFLSGGGYTPSLFDDCNFGREVKEVEEEEDDEKSVDAKTYKQRKWDAFTDDNKRGWGNRGNKG